MRTESKSRILVFVDEANITQSPTKTLNKTIDWHKFRDYLEDFGERPREIVEMVIYASLPPPTPEFAERRQAKINYLHWLRSQGFLVIERSGQSRNNGYFKANVDVIMAIDAMDMAQRIQPDCVILVTGDSDFSHLALTFRRQGIKVEIASLPQTLSNELRCSANSYIDLTDLFTSFDNYRQGPGGSGELEVIVKRSAATPAEEVYDFNEFGSLKTEETAPTTAQMRRSPKYALNNDPTRD